MAEVKVEIPLSEITKLSAKIRNQLETSGLTDLDELFQTDDKLLDAPKLAKASNLSLQETLKLRQQGRQHIEKVLTEIIAKKKVEPVGLLWKIHWLLGIVAEEDFRQELIALESSAIASLLENLDTVQASTLDKILLILLHRFLLVPESVLKGEIQQLVEFTEKFQRSSLLAYQTTKAKTTLLALAEEPEPTKRIIHLRKLSTRWKALTQVLMKRRDKKGQQILTALRATNSLVVLDLSEQHLKEKVQLTMTTVKLRQSQLTQITTAMNAAVDLRDAYLVAKLANRASQIWFQLAQGKSDQAFVDDLLRSLRFGRTGLFHFRALDDLSEVVKLLKQLIHILGEIPYNNPEAQEEAIRGIMKSCINTVSLLDRPADQKFILNCSKRISTIMTKLLKEIPDVKKRHDLTKLHSQFLQANLDQLQELGADLARYHEINRELIQTLLSLAESAPVEEQETYLNSAADRANQVLSQAKPVTKIAEQDLQIISEVAARLAQQPQDTLSDSAGQLIQQCNELNEQFYFRSKDPKVRAQLALQLLLSRLTPDTSGQLQMRPSTKEMDKLEEFASTALLTHAKSKQPLKALQAGSILVWLLLQRYHTLSDKVQRQKLKEDARDFSEQTFTFMPPPKELTGAAYPYAFLLLGSVNELVHDERPSDESKWHPLLTQSEQLAQTLAKAAEARQDTDNQILALSAAAIATAKIATLTGPGSKQSRFLTRATTQIRKAIHVAASQGSPQSIEVSLSQYNQIMRARLKITPLISNQALIFTEWNQTCEEAVNALRDANAVEVANRLYTSCLLNAQIPFLLTQLSDGKANLDAIRREITSLLKEAGNLGSQQQSVLAKQLEKRWAFQLGDDSLLSSGYRLEDAETSFTLADEHFRISLQIEPRITIDGEPAQKGRIFPYLRLSPRLDGLIWYEETPILCSSYGDGKISTWLTLQNPTDTQVSIGYWIIASRAMQVRLTFQIHAVETLSQDSQGVIVQLAGAQIIMTKQPNVAEHRDNVGTLIFELELEPGCPESFPLDIQIRS